MSSFTFPKDFIWGTATASYQVEGAVDADGRGTSTWDTFSRRPGKITNNDNGDIACDHYHLYKEDTAVMKSLNQNAYRFSIAWPRIMPEGEGKINQKGLDHYRRMIDHLLEAGIEPFITLFHWDLPQALEDKYGGWRSKDVSKKFADYSAIVVKEFADKVKYWTTINEISCFTILAHNEDRHAPGKFEPAQVVNQTVHNALYGHGLAVQAIRANGGPNAKAGLVENLHIVWPVYETLEHIAAAKKAFYDKNQNILFPVFTGKYSDEYLRQTGKDKAVFTDDEMKIIGSKLDYIGYNMYSGPAVRAVEQKPGFEIIPFPADYPKTKMDWPLSPKGLYWILKYSREYFGDIPTYITENGMAADDSETANGEILDLGRVEYLRTHLESVSRAASEGIPVKGYFIWSLLDNFEWALGYGQRFGLVYVDYATQKRTVKDSGNWFAQVVRENGFELS